LHSSRTIIGFRAADTPKIALGAVTTPPLHGDSCRDIPPPGALHAFARRPAIMHFSKKLLAAITAALPEWALFFVGEFTRPD
jgi:hypothetical protein